MKPTLFTTLATLSGIFATQAWSADYEVQRSLQLPVSSTEVWHLIGDFCDIDDWHPDIAACELEVIDGRLHRVLTTTEGAEIVEKRVAAEPGLSYTYTASSTPLRVETYTATISIEPRDGADVSWSVRFASDDPGVEAEVADFLETGLAAIGRMCGIE